MKNAIGNTHGLTDNSKEVSSDESDVSGKLFYSRVHRFQLSRLGSEFASDGGKGDRIFGSSSIYFVGAMLALGFFSQRLAQNLSAEFAGFAFNNFGNGSHRRGGFSMLLKMFVLSGAALTLWLVPLVGLDEKVSWHKSIQGLSLCSAIACAVVAGNTAKRQADEDEIELIKARAIKADMVDEISTSAYVSQTQRQQEAEAILNPVEHLERALAMPCEDGNELETEPQKQLAENGKNEELERRAERALELKAKGWGKAKIILEVWGVSKGGSQKYKDAEAEYKRLVEDAQES